ncbi:MAG: hypothetical protein PHZ09_13835 [Eubacteriales bacterium]|jgi:hypothetical protein|nr:hypothetical protein [Eubacteriales bacterium]
MKTIEPLTDMETNIRFQIYVVIKTRPICISAYILNKGAEIKSIRAELLETSCDNPDEYVALYNYFQKRKSEFEAQHYKDMIGANEKPKIVLENRLIDYTRYGDNRLFRDNLVPCNK